MQDTAFNRAVSNVGIRNVFRASGRAIQIACLIRSDDWRPLRAHWWRGKEVFVIGADVSGNFFLRHCDGSVRYWKHDSQRDEVIANSVDEFARDIIETE